MPPPYMSPRGPTFRILGNMCDVNESPLLLINCTTLCRSARSRILYVTVALRRTRSPPTSNDCASKTTAPRAICDFCCVKKSSTSASLAKPATHHTPNVADNGLTNNNNNNNQDNVYGAACHHGRVIARVHPVHLMNVGWHQAAADPRPSETT